MLGSTADSCSCVRVRRLSRISPFFVDDNGGRYTAGFAGDDAHHAHSIPCPCFRFISTAPCTRQPLVRCLAGVQVFGFFWEITSRNVSVFCVFLVRRWVQVCVSLRRCRWVAVSASQQRQVRTAQTVQLPVWTRMLTCPLLCSTDAPYRRAENCGAPQLQFVGQVETFLFGNRDRYAQCNCAVVSCHGWCLLDSGG